MKIVYDSAVFCWHSKCLKQSPDLKNLVTHATLERRGYEKMKKNEKFIPRGGV